MLFKIDENLPAEIAELLASAGHDAKTVHDQQLQGVKDSVLIKKCDSENRILLTLDTDFSDIRMYPPQEHEGIIVLKIGNQSKRHVVEVFQTVLRLIKKEPIKKRLWIVEETMIRIRGEDE
jgi:predicted nuclease of predicted toxin-antitoxin system